MFSFRETKWTHYLLVMFYFLLHNQLQRMWMIKTRRAVWPPFPTQVKSYPPQGRQTSLLQVPTLWRIWDLSSQWTLAVTGCKLDEDWQLQSCLPCCQHCQTESEQPRCHSASPELNRSTAFPGLAQDPNYTRASACFGVALRQVKPQRDRCLGWGGRVDFHNSS